jgi:hypothetical protein
MKDLSSARWIILKGFLFLLIGMVSAILIFLEEPDWQTGLLLALVIWSFCRFYYFAFYVIEKYVDPAYKFSGLMSFIKYLLQRRR